MKKYILIIAICVSCKTEELQIPPIVLTKVASDINVNNATLNGEVSEEGYSATSARGFVYSEKNSNPSVSDSKIESGYGKGVYSVILGKLTVNTKYFYKAFATNTKGTSYGESQNFTTSDYKLAIVNTDLPKNVTYTTVELGGFVTDEGGGNVSESGFVVSINPLPTISDLKFPISKGKSSIAIVVSKLNFNTKYFVRSYAINEKGVAYGSEQSFTTADYKLATITTEIPKNIGYNSVQVLGSIKDYGGGSIKESGFRYSTSPITTDNFSTSYIVQGLNKGENLDKWIDYLRTNTKYYLRAYAFNEKGLSLGNEQIFTTLNVTTVTSKTGRVWMDRNLGASQVATSLNDEKSYGDLYQWGRRTDGHQLRNSETILITSLNDLNNDYPDNSKFIITATLPSNIQDWRYPQNNNLWQGAIGTNNVCPTGFRIPTQQEWISEILSFPTRDNQGGFASPLKLPAAGIRSHKGNMIAVNAEESGSYWSSTFNKPSSTFNDYYSASLFLTSLRNSGSFIGVNTARGEGKSVRCIKD
jgi:uncharacterized protein (TIGR02145 family)